MSGEITTIIVSTLSAAIAAPIGAWVNSKILRQKYDIEIGKLRAEMEEKMSAVRKSELENVRTASEMLMNDIVNPLHSEIQLLRKDVNKFRRAVEKIPSCSHADNCPVSRELFNAEAGDASRGGKNGKQGHTDPA
ncbi:MAG: hypothetical protein E7124_03355 [Bacteroidales bacterium]|nr:hypothetical protein [Bacteroidales bacterium]